MVHLLGAALYFGSAVSAIARGDRARRSRDGWGGGGRIECVLNESPDVWQPQ